jgi:hypothetical protein
MRRGLGRVVVRRGVRTRLFKGVLVLGMERSGEERVMVL